MSDLISIIVPVYNLRDYLDRCVNSIVRQTYSNLEILLIDDGSTDGSGQLAEAWRQRDDRIAVYHKPNGGISDARNLGVQRARGSYLCFADADDTLAPDFVECLYGLVQRYSVKLAGVGFKKVCGQQTGSTGRFDPAKTVVLSGWQAITPLFLYQLYQDYTWNKIYARELFDEIAFPVGRMYEDIATAYLLLDRAGAIAYNPAELYFYLQRESSIVHSKNPKIKQDRCRALKERYLYLKRRYPEMTENTQYYFQEILHYHPMLPASDREKVKKELAALWQEVRPLLPGKQKAKYRLFCLSERLYIVLSRCLRKDK